MKIQQVSQSMSPFGGINFVINEVKKHAIDKFLDAELGKRAAQAQYSFSDVITSLWYLQLCGGECAEDMNQTFRDQLQTNPQVNIPSGDTILEVMKSLKTQTDTYTSANDVKHEFNIHDKLNRVLVRLLVKTKQLLPSQGYTFDYDNQIIATEKWDAKYTYKKVTGYQPGVATINDHIVYIENRNGNSNAKYKQNETLERAYKLLADEKITIERSRMDSASFQKDVIDVVKKNSKLFYIRAMRCDHMADIVRQITAWESVMINNHRCELASVEYSPFQDESISYRLVVTREQNKNNQVDVFTGDTYTYRSILTNDRIWSNEEVVVFYNQRGATEKVFDVMNNDFGWKKLPFSFLNENTVFLLITAMSKAIFTWLTQKFAASVKFVDPKGRLKKFIFSFTSVCAKWVRHGRQDILRIYTDRDYGPLLK